MNTHKYVSTNFLKAIFTLLSGAFFGLSIATTVLAAPITPDVADKVEMYKKKLTEWAANPEVIAAVEKSNASGGMKSMTNSKWDEMNENAKEVVDFLKTPASKFLTSRSAGDKGINKLYARDEKANLAAGDSKAALYNNASRGPFKNAIKGKPWSDSQVKEDLTTNKKSVQVSVPIMSGGKTIGVLHTAVTAN